jgi:hypothetical protein
MPFRIIQWWITRSTLSGALLAAFVLSSAITARTCDAQAQFAGGRPPGFTAMPKVTSPRLYVIDCGTLVYNHPEDRNVLNLICP